MKKIRCAIYDRVSTEMQVQSGLSLDTQKELLTEYAQSHGYEIIDYYADEGLTARKKLQNRKDFMRLLDDVKQGKIDLILVTKLDRWFRNVRDYHNTQAVLEAHNCNWKTILEDYDTSTADGQLKINIMLAVAQNESDRTSERIKVVFAHKRRNGEHITGAAAFGYKVVDKFYQKDESKAHIVDDIFNHYFSCFSKKNTIAYIQDKYREESPTAYQINRILTHDLYAGIYDGSPNYCKPYITMEQLQTIRNVCSSKTYSSATHDIYLFGQLLKCPHCSATMTGFKKHQKLKSGSSSFYKRYRCSRKYNKHSGGACISESVIEEYMLNHVSQELEKRIFEIKQREKSSVHQQDNSWKIKAEIDRLNLLFQKGRISEEYYDEQYSDLENKLKKEINKSKIISVEDYKKIKTDLSGNWRKLYQELDTEHQKVFWKRIIKEIYIDSDTHKICGFDFLV